MYFYNYDYHELNLKMVGLYNKDGLWWYKIGNQNKPIYDVKCFPLIEQGWSGRKLICLDANNLYSKTFS